MKTKIGIFGGSFNPVHEGHMAVACGVLARNLVDEVWFMPCRRNPLKKSDPEFSDSERMTLLREHIDNGPKLFDFFSSEMKGKLKITDVDLRLPAPSYTWNSLQTLSEKHPECSFTLIVGADSYADFHKWKQSDRIRENYGLIIYPRPGYSVGSVAENCTLLEGMKEYDLSSTQIRNKLKSDGYEK